MSLGRGASSRGFTFSKYHDAGDGRFTFEELVDVPDHVRRHRALNGIMFASTLTVVDGPLGLGVLGVAWSDP